MYLLRPRATWKKWTCTCAGDGDVSVSVSVAVWCVFVVDAVLSGGWSSMRCLLYLDIQSRRGYIIWLPLRGSWLLLPLSALV